MPQTLPHGGRDLAWRTRYGRFAGWMVLFIVCHGGVLTTATEVPSSATTNPALPPKTAAGANYAVTNLGAPWGDSSEANGINGSGQVVGWFGNATGSHHAFEYSKGQLQDLGTLGKDSSEATAINSIGQVVGWIDSTKASGGRSATFVNPQAPIDRGPNSRVSSGSRAFLYRNGKMQDLGTMGGLASWAGAINDGGQVAGTVVVNSTIQLPRGGTAAAVVPHLFLYSSGKMLDLGAGLSEATGIDSEGLVVGIARVDMTGRIVGTLPQAGGCLLQWQTVRPSGTQTPDNGPTGGEGHAGRYRAGRVQELDTLGGAGSMARAVNGSGQIVGWARTYPAKGDYEHASIFSDETRMKDLGTLGGKYSSAFAINSRGQIVGFAAMDRNAQGWVGQRAFLFSSGKMQDLNLLVGDAALAAAGFKVLLCATGINSSGQIAGYGEDLTGHHRAFLLTPVNGR